MQIPSSLPNHQVIRHAWRASSPGLTGVALFSLVINLLKFATPLFLLQVLDRVPASRSVETLVMLTAITFAAIIAGIGLEIVRRRMLLNWSKWLQLNLTPPVMRVELARSVAQRDLSEAVEDVGRIQKFAAKCKSWFDVVFAPLFFVGLFLLHPTLGWLAVATLCLLLTLATMREIITREPRREARSAEGEAEEFLETVKANRETVSAHTMAANLSHKWQRSAELGTSRRTHLEQRSVFLDHSISGVGRLARIGMIAIGAWLLLRGELTLGGLFAARVIAGFGFGLVERAIRDWGILRDARNGYRNTKARLNDTERRPATVTSDLSGARLVADALTFRYKGQRQDVFKRLSFELEPGQVLIVSGPAASGKTTLAQLIVGLNEPKFGKLLLGDVDVARLPGDLKARLIGYMPQETEVFSATILENISRFRDGPMEDAVAAARLLNIHDQIVQLPEGYDTRIGPDFRGLSGSELKRIALARAFYGRPRVIVLDDPFANLDRDGRRSVEAAIKQLRDEGSSVIVTQAVMSARLNDLADNFLFLDQSDGAHDSAGASKRPEARGTERHLRSVP